MFRSRRRALLALPLAAAALTGCGAGRHNQQYKERTVIDGTNASEGGLDVRDAYILTPVAKGGTAVMEFSLYADDPGSATQLTSVTADTLSDSPAALSRVADGGTQPVQSVDVVFQTGPGASLATATFAHVKQAALSATYVPMTFTFASGTSLKILVAVSQAGSVNPASTVPPTSFPQVPFPLTSLLPGESGAQPTPSPRTVSG